MSSKLTLCVKICGLVCVVLFGTPKIQADTISITSQPVLTDAIAGQSKHIVFGLSWNNSWRSSNPRNWDAAWIFAKYSVGGGDWNHCYLDSDSTQHSALSARSTNGGVTTNVDLVFECGRSRIEALGGALRTVGVFLHRVNNGNGNLEIPMVKLHWDYAAQGVMADDPVTVKVFAIEMVLINRGSFFLGSGGTEHYAFRMSYGNDPFKVRSEDSIYMRINTAGDSTSLSNSRNAWGHGGNRWLSKDFPKGYEAFYMMKHEVTQEAYVEFLNTLNVAQQSARLNGFVIDASYVKTGNAFPFGNGAALTSYRMGIMLYEVKGSGVFVCNLKNDGYEAKHVNQYNDGQNLPMIYTSFEDALAYLDWAGLRPLTELEFEKACRGPLNPVANEMVWGAGMTSAVACGNPQSTAQDNGEPSERPDKGNLNITTSSPIRVGSFAGSATSRTEAGAGYWGVMELAGNAYERYYGIEYADGLPFDGRHGDGTILSTNGQATLELNWPRTVNSFSLRASGFTEAWSDLNIATTSSRYRSYHTSAAYLASTYYMGIRGGRTFGQPGK